MQKLADIQLNENQSPELTNEEKIYLESEVNKFLSSSLYNSDILVRDSEDFNPTLEQKAIEFIIKTLENIISYY
jgi:hypothetical protein